MVSAEQGRRYQHSYAVAAVAAAADNVYALIPMYTVLGDDLQNTILLRFVGIRDSILKRISNSTRGPLGQMIK